jgi:hypothetical protein
MDTSQGIGPVGVPASLLETMRRRYNSAKYVADLWIPILQACFFYAVPFRNRFYLPGKEFQGTSQNTRVYDTTAVEAVTTFVSKLHDTMTPPGVQWGFLQVDDAFVDNPDDPQQITILQDAQIVLNKYMRQLFRFIHASNFDVIINECYYDLSIGTSAIIINQYTDDRPLLFSSVPMDKLSIEEAVNGNIESWYRTWQQMKIADLHTRWSKIILSPELISMMAANPDAVVRQLYEGVAYFSQREKNYIYCVWTDDAILFAEDLESSPGVIWRWKKTNNETWGRGCVMEALPSIISLNELARMELAAANLNIFKPYMGFSDAIFNPHTFKLQPFTIIPIAPIGTGGQVPLIPLPGSADIQIGQFTIADLRLQIKKLLFADEPQDAPGIQPQTAYELAMKQQNLALKIGPLFSRLQYESLLPILKRCGYILHKMGKLLFPEMNGIPIKFKYKSPLELVKGQEDVARFTQWVQSMQGVMGPDAAQIYVNPKTTPYLLADSLQVDVRYINKPEDVAKVMQQVQDNANKDKLAASGNANAAAETPQQPQNPSEQIVSAGG